VVADHGVYRSALTPPTWHQRLLAACLAGPAVASHRSGGVLWTFPIDDRDLIEVTAVRHLRRTSGEVIWHESYLLDERSVTEIDGVPVTSAARTVVDLAGVLPHDELLRVLDDALRRRLVTTASLAALVERLGPARIGAARMRAALELRIGRAVPESDLETRFEQLLRNHGLPMPVAQYEVVAPDRRRFRIDFAYPDRRVGIEVMGAAFHAPPDRWNADLERLAVLESMNWRMLVFSYEQVTRASSVVVAALEQALA
jgi:very-short-patch-repair endonuclease